jgi:hypothetical protein
MRRECRHCDRAEASEGTQDDPETLHVRLIVTLWCSIVTVWRREAAIRTKMATGKTPR